MSNDGYQVIRPLGPVTEAMHTLGTGGVARSGFCSMTLKGRMDDEAMKAAIVQVYKEFPALACRVGERRHGLLHRLDRIPLDSVPALGVMNGYADDLQGLSYNDALDRLLEPYYLRGIDVHNEAPAQFYLAHFPDNHHAMVNYFHHIGSDAGTMMKLIARTFAIYHELVKGEPPDWAQTKGMTSSVARRPPRLHPVSVIRRMRAEAARLKDHPLIRMVDPDRIRTAHRYVVRRTLTEDETSAMAATAKRLGMTVNDFVSVACVRAIDELLGTPEGTLSFWIPVNLRATVKDHHGRMNFASAVNVDLIREERKDREKLGALFVERRKAHMTGATAETNLRLLRLLLGLSHLFPERVRGPRLKKLFHAPMSFMNSNVGVLWPRFDNGKLTTDSVMTCAGDCEILDYDVNFSTDESLGHGLVAYTYRKRFTLNFSGYRDLFERETMERFLDIIKRELLE
ncbi:MAG: hypothetical protein M5R36_23350 [Deltaproteobacteria bacterium]|nr:hypothetical protein [Deltaproteobacteria bacterium]